MGVRGIGRAVVFVIAVGCSALAVSSCGRSPSAPDGRIVVSVLENGTAPSVGKRIEVLGTPLSDTTDASGLAVFRVRAGSYVVRAHEIGTPGPGRPFVDQDAKVAPAGVCRTEFFDCTMCR